MKFKCKDCGAVYDEKIEYCECGNNTFEEIEIQTREFIPSKTAIDKGLIISWSIFSFCILLSLLMLFAIPNGKPHQPKTEVPQETKTDNNIPDIEKIWKETEIPAPEEKTPAAPEPVVIIQKIIKRIEAPEPAVQKNVNKPAQPKPKTEAPRPVQKPNTSASSEPKQPVKTEVKPKEQVKPTPVTSTKPKTTSNDPTVIRYKNILREVLLSKLAVGSIPGEGVCVIAFSIDKSGKLINRKFVQYANNKPMNDAIYYMLMSVPRFQPPPAAYNGETIQMKFYINNGAYEISFQ